MNTLTIWNNVRKKNGAPTSLSRAMPITDNPDFRPSLDDRGFKRWAELGLLTVNQLFEGSHLKSFAQLQET